MGKNEMANNEMANKKRKERGKKEKKIFCQNCGLIKDYDLRKESILYEGDGYYFRLQAEKPYCKICGAPITVEEIEEKIAQEANERIREQRGLISRGEIIEILDQYSMSQKFLSRMLGWGEITLTRYINGNYTLNKENSDRLKELKNLYRFQELFQGYRTAGKEKESEKAIRKIEYRVDYLLTGLEEKRGKLFKAVDWFLSQASEELPITHLALQKLLYFVQCWNLALNGEPMFSEDCQAWVHGAVYPAVYDEFKSFQYRPLPQIEKAPAFSERELVVLRAVKQYYFDIYNAKALENICHFEEPYKNARAGYGEGESCKNIIKKSDMEEYYGEVFHNYGIDLEHLANIKNYLNDIWAQKSAE